MALQDRLDAFKADFVAGKLAFKPTKERLALMERALLRTAISEVLHSATTDRVAIDEWLE